jgi:hypothetical protein
VTSIDILLVRAKRLNGSNDDALEEEWNNLCAREHESLIADLEMRIANMTPEERAEEARHSDSNPFTPEEEAELEEFLNRGAQQAKAMYFQNARKSRHKRQR